VRSPDLCGDAPISALATLTVGESARLHTNLLVRTVRQMLGNRMGLRLA
jgi:hypothetical protein